MITLYQFHPCFNILNASPYCMKLEVYLKLTGLPYEVVHVRDPRKAPKGKLPYISDNGKIIADSGIIIDYLKKTYGDTLDSHLSPAQKALSLAIQRLLEEHSFWTVVYSRWIDPSGWAIIKPIFFAGMPSWMQKLITPMIRKQMAKALYYQGIGRHSADEIYQMGKNDITAISDLLGQQMFMLGGDKPTSIDATVYAFVANLLKAPVESPMKTYAMSLKNLVDYTDRMERIANDRTH